MDQTASNLIGTMGAIIVLVLLIKFGSGVNSIFSTATTQVGNTITALQGNG